ncbi:unnamed protein product [Caenorhabditis sp. 36 PRJEB53466]|nr:unnamed protein product [Caenorhabditis sp. 36 PRJEB53466]
MMKIGGILAATLLVSIHGYPAAQHQQTAQQYPGQQEGNTPSSTQQQPTAHHGYMYAPQQQAAQLSQFPTTVAPATVPVPQLPLDVQKTAQVLLNDPDFQMLARSLHTGTGSVGFSNPLTPRELPPCSTDGRSVTIDHLRISPESLVQIARLAQAFGTNPDWKKLRLADMKSALNTQMHPTHQYAARSIGL